MTSPIMISEPDSDLVGPTNRGDPMGVLPIWSIRGRDLVPHLTEQTTDVRGFQILVETFRLWEAYVEHHSQHAERLTDFFLLVEQAFARTVAWHDGDWPLPGARRVRGQLSKTPHISYKDPEWHLMGGQIANGLWGLYRGASRRAGLLSDDMTRLSTITFEHATAHRGLGPTAQARLFERVESALDNETVELPTNYKNELVRDLHSTFTDLPLANHLRERLIDGHDLNQVLAQRLAALEILHHRSFLVKAAGDLDDHRDAIENTIRCENLLAVVEASFEWLCSNRGKKLDTAVGDLPIDLEEISSARAKFGGSGFYGRGSGSERQAALHEQLDTSNGAAFARSLISLHAAVSEERGRTPWIWEEHGVLHGDVDIEAPSASALHVGVAWRNDYYLRPLKKISEQLSGAKS